MAPNDTVVRAHLLDLQRLKSQRVTNELALSGPFQNPLDKAARRRGWTLVPALSTYSNGKRVVPDGTVRDDHLLARKKKPKAGYPARNTVFEDTREAVLYQDGAEAGEFLLTDPVGIAALLNRSFHTGKAMSASSSAPWPNSRRSNHVCVREVCAAHRFTC